MAKTLIPGQTVESPFGDTWTAAILVADILNLNFSDQVMTVRAEIYRDTQARIDGDRSIRQDHFVDKATFLSEFDLSAPAQQLKGQAEDWLLTILDETGGSLIYGDTFE